MPNYRVYPNKSNTIIENSNVNTGQNGVTELWYGEDGITRYFVRFDYDQYLSLYQNGYVPHITGTSSNLVMKNCYPIFERYPYSDSSPSRNVEVEVKVLQQDWSEGLGHDFYGEDTVDDYCNWYSATSTVSWLTAGGDLDYVVFSGTIVGDGEDLVFDVTDETELWNDIAGDNFGICLKYADSVESLTGETKHILKFFTEKARTSWFKPYIELSWSGESTSTGTTVLSGTDHFIVMPTLKEEYGNSSILHLPVKFYQNYTSTQVIPENVEYKIDLIDGTVNFTMSDWETLHWSETENYIPLNTHWYHQNSEYRIQYRCVLGEYVNEMRQTFKFRVTQ